MRSTALLHKPVVYGSELADLAFVGLVGVHALVAALAVIAGLVALATRKGGRLHLRAGTLFVRGMVLTALSGIVIDGVRLGVAFEANHTKYAGLANPSSIPARLAFLFAAFALLYLVHVGGRRDFQRRLRTAPGGLDRIVPAALVVAGVALTALVVARFNPWTGALWMIATFVAAVVVAARERLRGDGSRASATRQHRFTMLVLAAFSWWGALQGFGPALALAVSGPDLDTTPYVGDRPGPFTPAFFGFLVAWAPAFVIAGALLARFAKRARLASARAG